VRVCFFSCLSCCICFFGASLAFHDVHACEPVWPRMGARTSFLFRTRYELSCTFGFPPSVDFALLIATTLPSPSLVLSELCMTNTTITMLSSLEPSYLLRRLGCSRLYCTFLPGRSVLACIRSIAGARCSVCASFADGHR